MSIEINFLLTAGCACLGKFRSQRSCSNHLRSRPRASPLKVFISCSHDSAKHEERILALAERLRKDGVDAQLDQYVGGPPTENWPRLMLNRLEWTDFVLVVCIETYYRRFCVFEKPGKGKGADWEGNLITSEIYDAKSRTSKFAPIFFDSKDEQFLPKPVRGPTRYMLNSESNYAKLYAFLPAKRVFGKTELVFLKTLVHKRVEPMRFDEFFFNSRCFNEARELGLESEIAKVHLQNYYELKHPLWIDCLPKISTGNPCMLEIEIVAAVFPIFHATFLS